MRKQTALRVAALAPPVLLALIVLAGERNRGGDQSTRVEIGASARAIDGTSYSGPRLMLSGEVLESREVDEKRFSPGSDVVLRYRKSGGEWTFAGAQTGGHEWNEATLDIPARIKAAPYAGGVKAEPLVPREFAIPDSTVSRIRRGARVILALRRGALGDVWVESATQTGDALGVVAALLADPGGGPPIVLGRAETPLDPRNPASREASGWAARLVDGRIGAVTPLSGPPIDGVVLSDGRLLFAIGASRGFDLSVRDADLKAAGEVRHFDGILEALTAEGSLWIREGGPGPGRGVKLVRRDLSGAATAEVALNDTKALLGIRGEAAAFADSSLLVRYRLDGKAPSETDRWTLDEIRSGCLLSADAIAVAARKGVLLLTAGVKEPTILLEPGAFPSTGDLFADRVGNLLFVTGVAGTAPRQAAGAHRERLFFRPAGGTFLGLPEVPAVEEVVPAASASGGNPQPSRRRFVVWNGTLFDASHGQMAVFDLAGRKLITRILERAGGRPERIF
ncbi:MAG TPA: hypothetical protein VMR54_14755 [Thermoanaerobaculia bacterium]|nr:hypothetical protein [Thermoanaerobaculia bacterium]